MVRVRARSDGCNAGRRFDDDHRPQHVVTQLDASCLDPAHSGTGARSSDEHALEARLMQTAWNLPQEWFCVHGAKYNRPAVMPNGGVSTSPV